MHATAPWMGSSSVAALLCAAQTPLLTDDLHRLVPTTSDPSVYALAHGDVDGDGDEDLVCGDDVFANDGSGYFARTACASPVAPSFVTRTLLGDLDGDLDLDLVLCCEGPDAVWLNDGNGCFSELVGAIVPPGTADWTWGAALGDTDGDGDLDLVLADKGDDTSPPGQTRLLLNQGNGAFVPAVPDLPQGWDSDPRAIALGDVDGDLDLDIFVWESRALFHFNAQHRLLYNQGGNQFVAATAQQFPTTASLAHSVSADMTDFDCDGDLDILTGGYWSEAQLFENSGTGTFVDATWRLPTAPDGSAWMAIGDLDQDQDVDFLLSDLRTLLRNGPCGTFTAVAGEFTGVPEIAGARCLLFDVDGDGDDDAVFGFAHGSAVWFGDGSGQFEGGLDPLMPWCNWAPMSLAVGDVDGDGDVDVLAGSTPQDRLLLNRGNASFADATSQLPALAGFASSVALADVDGDADLDALFADMPNQGNGGTERLYLNDGSGHFSDASAQWPTPADASRALRVGDLDGDLDLDVLVVNWTSVEVYANDGQGVFTAVAGAWPSSAPIPSIVALADLDRDLDLDVLAGGWFGAELFTNDGSAHFAGTGAAFASVAGFDVIAIALRDVDGDLDVDVAMGVPYGSPSWLRLFVNDGAGAFTESAGQAPVHTQGVSALAIADLDGDGDLDWLTGYPQYAHFNDGSGSFTSLGFAPHLYVKELSLADFDRDGDADVACASWGSPGVGLLVNLRHQLALRGPARIGQPARFDLWGEPNRAWTLFGSYAQTNLPLGATGVLAIARSQIFFQVSGVLDLQGRAAAVWNVPNDPLLAGTSRYWQVLLKNPRRLTNLEITTLIDL